MVNSLRQVAKWILRNTIESKQSLTPELALRLITESSPLWKAGPEMCPFSDPYWAFYWPGGQAVTRYILDYSRLFSNANVLDFGCGCGSASIAASKAGANVMANDIDPRTILSHQSIYHGPYGTRNSKLVANFEWNGLCSCIHVSVYPCSCINYRKNGVSTEHTQFISENLLDPCQETSLKQFLKAKTSFIILGDMFYDVDFAEKLFCWLKRLKETTTVRILVGDPNRPPLAEEQLERYTVKVRKQLLAEYQLPQCVRREHYGFHSGSVYELQQFNST